MIAVEPMLDVAFLVYFIEDLVSVLFSCCCEDSHLVVLCHGFDEFLCVGSDIEGLVIGVEMNKGFV